MGWQAACAHREEEAAGKYCLRLAVGTHRARLMTPREYARLQGVLDSYIISQAPNKALFGFGDAVCVPAIQWISTHVISLLEPAIQMENTTSVAVR